MVATKHMPIQHELSITTEMYGEAPENYIFLKFLPWSSSVQGSNFFPRYKSILCFIFLLLLQELTGILLLYFYNVMTFTFAWKEMWPTDMMKVANLHKAIFVMT